LGLPWLAQAQEQYYGTRLATVALAGAEAQDDLEALPIHAGDILTPENVRASIQTLYQTGHYSTIEVDAAPAANGGAALTFRVQPNHFFSTFRIEPDTILDRPLSTYFRLPIGERFTTTALERVIADTLDRLKSEGYLQAAVTADTKFDEETHLAFVTLKASPGPKAKVGTVRLRGGEDTFPPMELSNVFGLKSGDDFTIAGLEKG